MKVLAIDIGSSSVKAAVLRNAGRPRTIVRAAFPTRYDGRRAEVDARAIERAVYEAIHQLDDLDGIDLIAPTGMAPSWLAMDARGRAITPIVTHQDRRSVDEACAIQEQVGVSRHLKLAGNNPVPGSISSTTYRWFNTRAKDVMRRADLIGHLNTWLLRNWCGVRAIDTSNASFTGLFNTCTLKGWNDDLLSAARGKTSHLPEVFDANRIAGRLTTSAAARVGVAEGTPVLTGIMDGSCAMLLAGMEVGQAVNVLGSTDVLAVCTDRARPFADLLTRALGVGRRWLSVGTLAASGNAIDWVRRELFRDLDDAAFYRRLAQVADRLKRESPGRVRVDPSFAGSRTQIESSGAAFSRLTLGTTRDDLLEALCDSLARASQQRLDTLRAAGVRLKPTVVTSGGKQKALAKIMHHYWHEVGRFRFVEQDEPTLRGLWTLAQMASE